jgi:hypothetical protein
MSIKLIEYDPNIKNIKVTEHCYTITWLKRIIDLFPEDHVIVLSYIFYMSCPNPDNPYFNIREFDREERICRDLQPEFDREDLSIILAIDKAKEMYNTPVMRAHEAISGMIDNLNEYIKTSNFTDGKEGNVTSMMGILKNYKQIRESYNDTLNEVIAENAVKARGNANIPYDQR